MDGTSSLLTASWDITKTVIVAFLGLFGFTIKRLHTRMDSMETRIEKKIDHLTTRIDKLIDGK